MAAGGEPYTVADLTYEIQAPWEQVPVVSTMRQAQFKIPKAEGDPEDAELAVFYFGPGQGGDVDDRKSQGLIVWGWRWVRITT